MSSMKKRKNLTADQIRERLQDHNLSAVASATGLSNDTLYRLMHKQVTPSPATIILLSIYLQRGDA